MIKYMISVYIHVVSSKKKTRPAAAGSEPRQGPGGPKEVPRIWEFPEMGATPKSSIYRLDSSL
jgi:hypothetical protein